MNRTAATTITSPTVSHRSRRSKLTRRGLAVAAGLALPLIGASSALAAPASPATVTSKPNFRIVLSTHTVAFGNQNLNSTNTMSVKLSNTGAKAVHPESLFTGSPELSLSANSCTGNKVAAGKSCTFTFSFTPTAAGTVNASLKVLTDEGTAAQSVAVSGTGVQQLMESYNYLYSFTSPPVINGVAAPQSYQGVGYAPVGTYQPGQVIPVMDSATGLRQVGTYRIGNVNNSVPLSSSLNQVGVSEYDWGTNHYIVGTGLGTGSGGSAGLGSEHGSLIGLGIEGSNAPFSDQQAAIEPIHF